MIIVNRLSPIQLILSPVADDLSLSIHFIHIPKFPSSQIFSYSCNRPWTWSLPFPLFLADHSMKFIWKSISPFCVGKRPNSPSFLTKRLNKNNETPTNLLPLIKRPPASWTLFPIVKSSLRRGITVAINFQALVKPNSSIKIRIIAAASAVVVAVEHRRLLQ